MARTESIEVVIPVYNGARTLERALKSVFGQSVPIAGVTVVDDGSRDATAAIVERYPQIRYVRNETNLGMCRNWNRCLDLARSSHVVLLHQDDVLLPEWHACAQRALALASDPAETSVYCGHAAFLEKGGIRAVFSFAPAPREYAAGALLPILWNRGFYGLCPSGAMLYSRRAVERLHGFPDKEYPHMADVPLHWELLLETPLVYSPEVTALMQVGHASRGSEVFRDELALGALRSFCAVRQRLAAALHRPIERLTADYLFPYAVMRRLHRSGRKRFSPEVQAAMEAAAAGIPVSAWLQAATGHAVEYIRRERCNRGRRAMLRSQLAALPA